MSEEFSIIDDNRKRSNDSDDYSEKYFDSKKNKISDGLASETHKRQKNNINWGSTPIEKIPFCAPTLVIDLSYESFLTVKELKSLAAQIKYSYSSNKNSVNPLKMVLSNLIPNSSTEKYLKLHDGYEKWRIYKEQKSILELWPKSKIIYLSPESPKILTEIDKSKVYVVGGIVDDNRLKGLSEFNAQKMNLETAKLPINEALTEFCNQSLNINHVVEIMVDVSTHGDFKKAIIEHVPIRYKRLPKPRERKKNPQIKSQ